MSTGKTIALIKAMGGAGASSAPAGNVSYMEGYRISASTGEVSANAATDLSDFIAVGVGDRVALANVQLPQRTANVGVHFYAEDKATKLMSAVGWDGSNGFPGAGWTYTTDGGNVTSFVVPDWTELEGTAYMRIVASEFTDRSAVVVEHNAQSGGGASLPEAGPYEYLVTDGEGNWGTAERLAWKEGEKVEITWDGNTEGLTSVGDVLFKVSDKVLSQEAVKNGVITMSDGTTFAFADTWDNLVQEGMVTEGGVVTEDGVFVFNENFELDDFVFDETGVYFPKVSMYATDAPTYTCSFVSDMTTIHPIPKEYLPQPLVFESVGVGNNYSVNMSFEQWCAIYDVDKYHRVIETDRGGTIRYLQGVNDNRDNAVPHFNFRFVKLDTAALTNLYFLEDGTVTTTSPSEK